MAISGVDLVATNIVCHLSSTCPGRTLMSGVRVRGQSVFISKGWRSSPFITKPCLKALITSGTSVTGVNQLDDLHTMSPPPRSQYRFGVGTRVSCFLRQPRHTPACDFTCKIAAGAESVLAINLVPGLERSGVSVVRSPTGGSSAPPPATRPKSSRAFR